MIKNTILFFNKIENRTRRKLSQYPILYAFIGGIGVVLFWRGIWHIADDIAITSVASLVVGTIILLLTGIFVSDFIGKKLIITGLVGEKKMAAEEEEELETEESELKNLKNILNKLEKKMDHIDDHFRDEHKEKNTQS